MFSKGTLGQGLAVLPSDGKVVSPCEGEIIVVPPTQHAIGIRTKNGIEVLIHIGLKTEALSGNEFKCKKKIGDKVKIGDVLMDYNYRSLKRSNVDLLTIIVITNTSDFVDVIPIKAESVERGDQIIAVI